MNDVESRQQEHDETKLFLQFLDSNDETIDFKEWPGLIMLLDKIKSLSTDTRIFIHYSSNYCSIWPRNLKYFNENLKIDLPLIFESCDLVGKDSNIPVEKSETVQQAIYTACLKFVNYYINGK